MASGLMRIMHIKLPVTDVQRSAAWYTAVLGLETAAEFAEHGVIRGFN